MKRRHKIVIAMVSASSAVLFGFLLLNGEFYADRIKCKQRLQSIGAYIQTYRSDNFGMPPSDLQSVDNGLLSVLLHCPATGSSLNGQGILSNSQPAFIFINWSNWFGPTNPVPGDYPILYDASLTNHHGVGVNILFVDGKHRWDKNAKWLLEFSRAHTNYDIKLPSNVPK